MEVWSGKPLKRLKTFPIRLTVSYPTKHSKRPSPIGRERENPRQSCSASCGSISIRETISDLHALARLGLDDFDFGVAGADLVLKPVAGIALAVAQENCPGLHFTNEVEQGITIGVGRQIGAFQVAAARHFARRAAQDKGLAELGGFDAATGRSEEHTSELQSHSDLVCRLLLEKKKKNKITKN